MATEKLREIHLASPFNPFTIVMGDGTRYRVPHPEFLAYAPKSRIAVVFEPNGKSHFVDLLLMTAIELDSRGGKPRGGRSNGSRHRN